LQISSKFVILYGETDQFPSFYRMYQLNISPAGLEIRLAGAAEISGAGRLAREAGRRSGFGFIRPRLK
jgi:hypothetical protein